MLTVGLNAQDMPVPGDYDGDGVTDIAALPPCDRIVVDQCARTRKERLCVPRSTWGNRLDIPVPGDYDGDGKTDRRRVSGRRRGNGAS